jgi:hypothetical protein
MYTPTFPYKGKQAIISSDRVQILAKNEAIILFADECIVLSSPGETHINSDTAVLIDSPKIELGADAEVSGEPVILGREFINQLTLFLKTLESVGNGLQSVKGSGADIAAKLVDVGGDLETSANRLNNFIKLDKELKSKVLSNITYTR